jgi:tyrosine-protein kinase Etk/Wzc
MSENQTALQQPTSPDDAINLVDLLIVLAKHKKMILVLTFAAALVAVGISLLMPNIYTGMSKILPPESSKSSSVNSIMLAQLGGLTGTAGAALGLKDPNALYLAMLKSRNIMEKIVRHFDLQTVYEEKTMTDALKALEKESTITSGKDGVIVVEVDDKDPQRAAALANAYIEELNKLMQTFALTEASQRGQFFENQMKPAKDKLTDAEITLDRTPNTSLQYMDALRNLRYQESIYDILATQFASAKLDEAKDSPLIQILDKAIPPEKKSKPKRSLIVILATLAAFFMAIIWAFIKEALTRSKSDPEQDARLQELRRVFRWSR